MQTPVHVKVLDRTYTLRVAKENADRTRAVADKVDRRMRAFQRKHPEQAKLTTAIITALALAEDLQAEREERAREAGALDDDLQSLTSTLDGALAGHASSEEASAKDEPGEGGEDTTPGEVPGGEDEEPLPNEATA